MQNNYNLRNRVLFNFLHCKRLYIIFSILLQVIVQHVYLENLYSSPINNNLPELPEKKVNILADDSSIEEVFNEITYQTKYTFIIDPALEQIKISGRFTNIPMHEFLNRIFKGNNIVVETDIKSFTIKIRSFTSTNNNISLQDDRYYKTLQDPNNIDPESGLTVGYVKALREKQQAQLKHEIQDPNTIIDPESGLTVGYVKALREKQQAQLKHEIQDPNTIIDPESGLTVGYVKALREKQQARLKQEMASPNHMDPSLSGNMETTKETVE